MSNTSNTKNYDTNAKRTLPYLRRLTKLGFLYGCLSRADAAKMIPASIDVLNKDYKEFMKMFSEEMVGKGKNRASLRRDHIVDKEYNLLSSYRTKPIKEKTRQQLIALEAALKDDYRFDIEAFMGYLPDEYAESIDERTVKQFISEVSDTGIIEYDTETKEYYVTPSLIKGAQLTLDETGELIDAVRYFNHRLFPAYFGYKVLDSITDPEDDYSIFTYSDSMEYTVLDEDVIFKADEIYRDGKMVKFDYNMSVPGSDGLFGSYKQSTETIVPLGFVHEMTYGRTFFIGYKEEDTTDLCSYLVDRMSDIRATGSIDTKSAEYLKAREWFEYNSKFSISNGTIDKDVSEPVNVTVSYDSFDGRRTVTRTTANYMDLAPWIRSLNKPHIESVVSIESNKDITEKMIGFINKDLEEAKKNYEKS